MYKKDRVIQVMVTKEKRETIEEVAKRKGLSVSSLCAMWISEKLEEDADRKSTK